MKKRLATEILPNPNVEREPCVLQCADCTKQWDMPGCMVCVCYRSPKTLWRLGCPMADNKKIEQAKGRKINPLKASKRGH